MWEVWGSWGFSVCCLVSSCSLPEELSKLGSFAHEKHNFRVKCRDSEGFDLELQRLTLKID